MHPRENTRNFGYFGYLFSDGERGRFDFRDFSKLHVMLIVSGCARVEKDARVARMTANRDRVYAFKPSSSSRVLPLSLSLALRAFYVAPAATFNFLRPRKFARSKNSVAAAAVTAPAAPFAVCKLA